MKGDMPPYRNSDITNGCLASECDDEVGYLTDTNGNKRKTPLIHSSYHELYNSIYNSIVNNFPPFITGAECIAVIQLIELAYESSKTGEVLPVKF